jgi:DNA-binding IscR family transcriptional regulator
VLCSHHDDSGRGCATKLLWTRVQVGVLKTLAHTTLAELVDFQTRQLPGASQPIAPTPV